MSADGGSDGGFGRWLGKLRGWASRPSLLDRGSPPKIGLALGGGFARGITHIGVLRVLERHGIPISYIAGVSAGSIVAAAYASGTSPDEIGRVAASMKFSDVASWSISRMGVSSSKPMELFLEKLLKKLRFEDMRIPLLVTATDLNTGEPVYFHTAGDVRTPIRASCSYPGLFPPIPYQGRLLVDGAMSVDIPTRQLRRLGATRILAVHLPIQSSPLPGNMFQVVNRCFQIMQHRLQKEWRRYSDVVLEPPVSGMGWDSFPSSAQLIEAGEKTALAALPAIQRWLAAGPSRAETAAMPAVLTPNSKSA